MPLTAASAQAIAAGAITFADGTVDTTLAGKTPLVPEADDDGDGLTNAQEVSTYVEGGVTYMRYASHPLLADTDGDGYTDGADKDPLSWDTSVRDAIIAQELSYRSPDYQREVLSTPSDQFTNLYDNRLEFKLANRELGPYWEVARTWDEGSGFDATLFTFSNKTLPFLKNGSANILAIRGTGGDGGGDGDVGADLKLVFGTWPGQADNAIALATQMSKTVSAQNATPKLTVTGHSLGGFLTQIFTVRAIGRPYGEPSAENDNYNYNTYRRGDTEMLNNLQFVHAYTFNAPKIKCTSWLINPWMCQYELIGRITTNHDRITHYAVPNDTVVGAAGGNFPGAIMLPASDAGHSSRSFFEDKYIDVPGFSVGKRRGLSGEGYQDPVLAQMHFVEPTVVTVVDTFGTVLSTKKYFWTSQQEANAFDVGALVPEHHSLQGTATAPTLGKTTTYKVAPDSFTYTYLFFRAGDDPASAKALKRSDITVWWGQAYDLPTLPTHKEQDCTWTTGDALPRVSPTEITENREFTVFLTEVCAPVTTSITLVDADSGKRVGTVERVTPEGATITLTDADLPDGYTWAEGEPKSVVAGTKDAVVKVTAIRLTVTYRYMNGETNVGTSSESLAWGADSSGVLTLPEGYALVDPSASWVRTHVTDDLTVYVPVKKNVYQVVYRFIHQGATVGTQSQSVSHGDSAAAPQAPSGYRLASAVSAPTNVTGPQNINVEVTPIEWTITYRFMSGEEEVGTPQTETVLDGRSATGAYTLPSGYVADPERGVVLPTDVHGDATVTVPVKKAQWTITYVFVDADSAAGSSTSDGETPGGETTQYTTVGEPVTEEVTHGKEARKVLTAPEGWELTQDLPVVGKVTESRTLTIPVRRKTETPKPGETPTPKPAETSSPKPGETPVPKPGETSTPKPGETPVPKPGETSSPKPVETSSPKPGETSSPKPVETSAPKPGETSSPKPAQTPSSSAEPSGEQAAPGHSSEATPGSTAAPTAQTTAPAAGARGLLASTGVQVRAAALLAAAALIAGTVLLYRARRRR